jgi:elongation factor Ts
MAITATQVNELRQRTGSGMMECKKALQAADGDIEKAIEAMRIAGQAKADKKADRTAAEGIIILKHNAHAGIMIEINSETDFVSRDTNFKEFAEAVAHAALHAKTQDVAELAALTLADGTTVEVARKSLIAKLGENINIRRLVYVPISEGVLGTYVHGGRIGVIVHIKGEGDVQLAKDLAMHIAANNPLVIAPNDLPQELIEKERDIYTAQAQESGKPAEIVDKMIKSRLSKYLDEVSLLGQSFVKDPSVKVENLLKTSKTEIVSFTRYAVGEGIEKKVGNFAEEVRAQVEGAA